MAGSGDAHLRPHAETLLSVHDLTVEFRSTLGGTVHAVSGVSFDIRPGETLALVGESACGKSSTARAVLQLPRPTSGSVWFEGSELTELSRKELRSRRPAFQTIAQDPIGSLNPRRRVGELVEQPLAIWRRGTGPERRAHVDETLRAVGLDPDAVRDRFPHQFSGGQCQRICIARALVLRPRLMICDEPVSALDVSIRAQILNLLEEMRTRYGLAMLFISHDLSVVRRVSDRVAVMYLGKLCEVGAPEAVFTRPRHPYTAALLAAIPAPSRRRNRRPRLRLAGDLPSPVTPPSGCRFHTRCPRAQAICREVEPTMVAADGPDRAFACHFPLQPPRASASSRSA
jgi:peptide/nickel transport system ATP-binding protein